MFIINNHISNAIQAIKFSAADYLLKPVNPKELIDSIVKIQEEILFEAENNHVSLLNIKTLLSNLKIEDKRNKKIVLKTLEKIHVVEIKTVIRCEADHSYTIFFLESNQKIILSKNLIEYDELLKDYGFIRTHKSHLVNIEFIDSFDKQTGYIFLKDKSKIPVSVRKKESVFRALDSF